MFLDVLLPAWHHGVPVVARRLPKFDPEQAFKLLADLGVRNAFLPPTALKIMRSVERPAKTRLRSIGSGGETLGAEMLEWSRETFGVTVNEFYGQTECNLVVRSEEHTSELQSLMRISYAVFCLKKKKNKRNLQHIQ